jgi:hypothetical protein
MRPWRFVELVVRNCGSKGPQESRCSGPDCAREVVVAYEVVVVGDGRGAVGQCVGLVVCWALDCVGSCLEAYFTLDGGYSS